MCTLCAVEFIGSGVGLHFLRRGVAVRVGDLGCLSLSSHNSAVAHGHHWDQAEGEEEDGAMGKVSLISIEKMERSGEGDGTRSPAALRLLLPLL